MGTPGNPHDKFFKEVFSRRESAIDFVKYYLPPEISSLLDLSTLTPTKDSFIDDEFKAHYSDLLFQVEMKGAEPLFIYILFEHKSSPDYRVAFQLLRYMVRIWEHSINQHKYIAPIFPLVIYHGEISWKVSSRFHSLFQLPKPLKPHVPDFKYWLCDISHYSDRELRGNVLLQVGLRILKYIFRDELAEKLPEILRLLRDLTEQRTGLEYLEILLRYISSTRAKITDNELHTAVKTAIAEGENIMSTLAEKWIEEGREEGWAKGRKEGREEGRQAGISEGIRLGLLDAIEFGLDMKFGVQGMKELSRISKIDDINLLRAIRSAIKSANTLKELRQLYEDHPSQNTQASQ